jgi:hypothetical protein
VQGARPSQPRPSLSHRRLCERGGLATAPNSALVVGVGEEAARVVAGAAGARVVDVPLTRSADRFNLGGMREIARVTPGTVLAVATAAVIVALAFSEPSPGSDSLAQPGIHFERHFLVPERSIPIPVDPALVHPGWCQPATAPICQEI